MPQLPGKVYLVGGGPGDPGLLTLRGCECLRRADLVLYDGLVNPWLLRLTRGTAERTARTNHDGQRLLDQEQINGRLIEAARSGKTVVRLKGGDPLVFGRGAEEAAALRAAGIPYEIVPGVTAAIAASAYAGISLTHRNMASSVALVTGHEHPGKPESFLDYKELANFPGTLVFYMGLHHLQEITEALIEAGKPDWTPVAVISHGTRPQQRTIVGTLGDIGAQAQESGLRPPSLIVVGEVATLRESLAWFEQRPLFGMTIGLTRPSGQLDDVATRAFELGAQPLPLSTMEILPPDDWDEVDRDLAQLPEFDWLVFTSSNGVEFFLRRLWETGGDPRRLAKTKIAVIGAETAHALETFHLRADLVPESFRAEALAEKLAPLVRGTKVLWARANRGRDVLPDQLRAAGADFHEVVTYRHVDVQSWPIEYAQMLERDEVDWIGLSSPSIAAQVAKLVPNSRTIGTAQRRLKLASIRPVTTAAARAVGLTITAEATTYTWEGIFEAVMRHNRESQPMEQGPESWI
ncbi:MAG: uroporphyrinogen-III C-methyltransferase [Planctomycetales bacterium]